MLNTAVKDAAGTMRDLVVADLSGFKSPVSERRFALMLGDTVMAIVALVAALGIHGFAQGETISTNFLSSYWFWFPIVAGSWWVFAWLNDLYHIPSSHDRSQSILRVGLATAMGLAIFFVTSLVIPFAPPFPFIALAWVMLASGVLVWRYIYVSLSDTFLPFYHRVLIVGRGRRAKVIADVLKQTTNLNYELVGYLEDADDASAQWKDDLPTFGFIPDLASVVNEKNVHQVVVATEGHVSEELFNALVACQGNGVPVAWMPDAYEKLLHRIPVQYIDPAWGLLALQDKPIFRRLQLASKRALDLTIFVLALPVFAFVVPVLAAAIKLDSQGPVFYKQVRSGRGAQPFTIYKFRTMVTDAEKNGAQWAQKNDSRITRVGRFLRKTRLDELPQIINVLRGEMSFVGPRPERPEFVQELAEEIPFYSTRMLVKPGLTGWAQIHYDYGNTVEDARMKLEYDFYYVRYWSLWMDIYILFRTIAVVVQFKGM